MLYFYGPDLGELGGCYERQESMELRRARWFEKKPLIEYKRPATNAIALAF